MYYNQVQEHPAFESLVPDSLNLISQ